jgi:type IV pilus assembly protein PilC
MPRFIYQAADARNNKVKGSLEAKDVSEAKLKLRQSGLYITALRKEKIFLEKIRLGQVSKEEVAIFSHQFSAMISSGVPLVRTLRTLAEENVNRNLRYVIDKIRTDVENGSSLADALGRHPRIFSKFFVSSIKSGELAGILSEVFHRLARYLEKEIELRKKVVSSFAYPIIVGIVAFGAVMYLLIFVVPVFNKVYNSLKLDLPGPTLTLIALSNFFIKFWWLLLIMIVIIYSMARVPTRFMALRLLIDSWKLKLPIFGQLLSKVAVSRFIRTLSTMITSGLPLNTSLSIVAEVVGNRVYARAVDAVQKDINQGQQISASLKAQGLFPPIVIQMVSVGEESGNIVAMFDKCADFLDESIDGVVRSLVVKLEPTLTFFLAVFVGFIAMAIYLPMFDLIRQVSR